MSDDITPEELAEFLKNRKKTKSKSWIRRGAQKQDPEGDREAFSRKFKDLERAFKALKKEYDRHDWR